MSSRRKTKPSKDHKIFRRTAISTRKVNIAPTIFRGGIRL